MSSKHKLKRELSMPIVFIFFIVIPIIEITLLINVGQAIGAWYTIALVLLSAFIGVNMLRYQGLSTLSRAQAKMNQGEMPQQEMVEGIVLAVGGALLITPGFVTDIIGFCCLIPLTRIGFIKLVSAKFKHRVSTGGFSQMNGDTPNMGGGFNASSFHTSNFKQSNTTSQSGEVFEGEYTKQQDSSKSVNNSNIDLTKDK